MRTVVKIKKKKTENRQILKDSMSPWVCHVVMQILVIFLIHQPDPVPERPIRANPGLKILFRILPSCAFYVIITVISE